MPNLAGMLLAVFAIVVSGLAGFQGDVAIRGTVTDAVNHRPIPGAVVYALSDTDLKRRVTDARGRFTFFALLPGNYWLYAEKGGYGSCDFPAGRGRTLEAPYEYEATVWLANRCL